MKKRLISLLLCACLLLPAACFLTACSDFVYPDADKYPAGSVASLESTSGGITVTEPKDGFSELKIDTTSGDVRVGLQKEDCSILAETTSGDFRCDFPALMKDGQYIIGEGKNRIVIDTTSGNIEIFKP